MEGVSLPRIEHLCMTKIYLQLINHIENYKVSDHQIS